MAYVWHSVDEKLPNTNLSNKATEVCLALNVYKVARRKVKVRLKNGEKVKAYFYRHRPEDPGGAFTDFEGTTWDDEEMVFATNSSDWYPVGATPYIHYFKSPHYVVVAWRYERVRENFFKLSDLERER